MVESVPLVPPHYCVNGHECQGVDPDELGRDVNGHGCAVDIITGGYTHPDTVGGIVRRKALYNSLGTPRALSELPPLEEPDCPLVSIITPTCGRPDLARCIESVREQTYRPLEHVIVADGPIPEPRLPKSQGLTYRYIQLGRSWTHPRTGPGCYANNVGFLMAEGEYLYPLNDDDYIAPKAIETLVGGIHTADWAWSQAKFWRAENLDSWWIEGDTWSERATTPNQFFHHRLLLFGMYQPSGLYAADKPAHDIDLVQRWRAAGAKGVFIPEVLHFHSVDH